MSMNPSEMARIEEEAEAALQETLGRLEEKVEQIEADRADRICLEATITLTASRAELQEIVKASGQEWPTEAEMTAALADDIAEAFPEDEMGPFTVGYKVYVR